MIPLWLTYILLGILTITSLILLLSSRWQWSAAALSVQYLVVAILALGKLSVGLAGVKLITGAVAAALLFANRPSLSYLGETVQQWTGIRFKILSAALVWLLVASLTPVLQEWLPASPPLIACGILLVGMGILQLGMTVGVLRIILGLLTTLMGFEVLYSAIETSALVAALLSGVTLGLAAVGSFLLLNVNEVVE